MNRALAGINSSNPYIAQRAKAELPMIQQSILHAQDKVDAAAFENQKILTAAEVKAADKKIDIENAKAMAFNLHDKLSPDQVKLLDQAAFNGTKAVQPLIESMFRDGFTAHFKDATSALLKGYPPGTVGQVNDKTGELVHVYNPSSDRNDAAQLLLSQYNSKRADDEFAFKKEQQANAIFSPETIKFMAEQAWAGDKSVMQNLGRGMPGAQNTANLRAEITNQGKGRPPGDLARMNQQFVGELAAQRAIGNRAGASTFANVEMPQAVQLSKDAYSKLTRDTFVPFNKLRRIFESNTSNPEQAVAYATDEDAISSYARALNSNGIPRKADIERGEKMLNNASSIEAHNAVLDQMLLITRRRQGAGHELLSPGSAAKTPPATGAPNKGDMTPDQAAAFAKYKPVKK
jgi:hypothetical protein